MKAQAAANRKLEEAEFFFVQMRSHSDKEEFRFFLSAFLSALFTCTEHNLLRSSDPRFKGWYRQAKEKYLKEPTLVALREYRRQEVHFKGPEISEEVSFSYVDGLDVQGSLVVEIDSRRPRVMRYRNHDMSDFKEHPTRHRWVWDTPNEPDVLGLCKDGLVVVRSMIGERNGMSFPD